MFKKNAVNNGKTHDIIYSLAIAAPAAIAQAKNANLPEVIGLTGSDVKRDGELTGQWIRNNVTYKIDTFQDQNIQLPSALLRDPKKGDCKSISLLFLAAMEAAGHNCGFRFARYRNTGSFTHVYNFVLDNKKNIYTFDACLPNLKELQHYKEIKDMRVNYIAGAPMMIKEVNKMKKPTLNQLLSDDRYASIGEPEYIGKKKFFKKLGNFVKKAGGVVKTAALAPARGPFLVLVDVNFRGIARKLNEARTKNASKLNEFWLKLGGDTKVLNKAIDKGKDKKPFLGERVNGATSTAYIGGENSIMAVDDYEYIGFDPASITVALTSAAGILAAAQKLFKSLGIKNKKGEENVDEGIDPSTPVAPGVEPGEDFFANDPASDSAAKYAESGGKVITKDKTPGDQSTFKISPTVLAIGAAGLIGVYFLTKKK